MNFNKLVCEEYFVVIKPNNFTNYILYKTILQRQRSYAESSDNESVFFKTDESMRSRRRLSTTSSTSSSLNYDASLSNDADESSWRLIVPHSAGKRRRPQTQCATNSMSPKPSSSKKRRAMRTSPSKQRLQSRGKRSRFSSQSASSRSLTRRKPQRSKPYRTLRKSRSTSTSSSRSSRSLPRRKRVRQSKPPEKDYSHLSPKPLFSRKIRGTRRRKSETPSDSDNEDNLTLQRRQAHRQFLQRWHSFMPQPSE